ncbi:MAG: hypothetical protein NVSMB2_03240 [Chloroflexota bacterium]
MDVGIDQAWNKRAARKIVHCGALVQSAEVVLTAHGRDTPILDSEHPTGLSWIEPSSEDTIRAQQETSRVAHRVRVYVTCFP